MMNVESLLTDVRYARKQLAGTRGMMNSNNIDRINSASDAIERIKSALVDEYEIDNELAAEADEDAVFGSL